MASVTINHSIKGETKNILSISIPLITSQIIFSMSGFIGTIMVAHLDKNALAASVVVNLIWWTLCVLFIGLLNSASVLVSQQQGAKNYEAISIVMGQSFLMAFIIAIPVMLTMFIAPVFLKWSAQTPAVLDYARIYLHSLLWSMPGFLLIIVLEQFLTGLGRTKIVLAISILEVPFEIALIYVLMFGKLHLPACGIAGVGYGFTAAYSITAVLLAAYLYFAKFAKPYGIYKRIGQFHSLYFLELVKIGWPIGVMYLIEVGAFMITTFLMARFSSSVLAAHQIAFQYLGLTINIVFGMSQAVSTRIGQAAGRDDLVGVYYAAYVGMCLSFFLMLFIAIIYFLFSTPLIALDINTHNASNAELLKNAATLLGIIGLFQIFENFRIIEVGALRGLKDTKIPMLISFVSFWLIGIVCAYVFGFTFHLSGAGIWWGLTLGVAIGALILFFRMKHLLATVDLKEVVKI